MKISEFYTLYNKANKVTIDSRRVNKNDIFFAFSGANFNAATLAEKAIQQGAIAAVVEQREYENQAKNIFYAESTLTYLQELAKYHRKQLNIPVIGLTGSNGKTTTKELISAVLSQRFKVQFTQGNLNNHIGVPLTLLSIKHEHEIAVVEMGANHKGEIALLCDIAQPDYGYITNFGKAHLEGFGGFQGVIKGKSELYNYLKKNRKTILYNTADQIQKQKVSGYQQVISFGNSPADYVFSQIKKDLFIGIEYQNESAISNLTGAYNFNNLSAATALGLNFGLDFHEIKNAIENYLPTNMRSQILEKEDKLLVLDTYNANPSSMSESLNNFSIFGGTKTIIMGDMLELGTESKVEHRKILTLAKSLNFDQIITVGKEFSEVDDQLNFLDTEDLKTYLIHSPIESKNILLKGSRGIALEDILDFL